MRPIHSETDRLTRCPCCIPGKRKGPEGRKRSRHRARQAAKRAIKKELD